MPTMWRTPEALVEIGFGHGRVVMMNEAHDGLTRCIRTREMGRRILPAAHRLGVRHLAMEAVHAPVAAEANRTRTLPPAPTRYLAQPEMRAFIQAALDLGWTLVPYEAPLNQGPAGVSEAEFINWREEAQAENLVAALAALPQDAGLPVWCGNSHHVKRPDDGWFPMGYQFARLSGVPHFAIDQLVTVAFPDRTPERPRLLDPYLPALDAHGGTVGVLVEDVPIIGGKLAGVILGVEHLTALPANTGVDAYILSTQNAME